jgi:hypothetical protein
MNEKQHDFSKVPQAACMFGGGVVELGDNGQAAKSAPIKLKARSGDPIEHWFWGKVIHDLAGMRTHKPRLTVDYGHNSDEVLGYLNHFDITSGDLIASGALTPWREDDRASEVMFKMRQGVPYEASIFFGGDGIKIEEVPQGMVQTVNGRQFEGPGIIVREWPLRGVAICPYGADQNTESSMLSSDGGNTVSVEKIEHKENKMSEETKTVEAEAKAEEKPVEAVVVEAEAEKKAEEVAAQVVEQAAEATKELSAIAGEVARLTERIKTADETVLALTAERDALKSKFDESEKGRLAAVEELQKVKASLSGAKPLSTADAENGKRGTMWDDARKSKTK